MPIKLVDDDGIRFFYVDEEHELVIKIFDPWTGFHEAQGWIYSRPWIDVDVEVTMLDSWHQSRRRYTSRWIQFGGASVATVTCGWASSLKPT